MSRRIRVDQRVVELGLESSRSRARARILAGDVRLGDRVLDKPGHLVAADAPLEIRERRRFVSRGGEKLAGALDALQVDPAGLRCVDAGASTGGFTDCLLQRGARHFELPAGEPRFDLVTADLSFISLRLVLPRLADLAVPGGRLLLLVKPQFELERGDVGAGGVVRDPDKRREAVERVRAAAAGLGLSCPGQAESVLSGPKGNREVFLLLVRQR
jgi:23S rRNA (cytidine1920-2'-O)/16S rRNA (cytidine1409-2'-O)-methyltransferase